MAEFVSTPGKAPAGQRRGIDPRLFGRREPSVVRLVQASCEVVAELLSQEAHVNGNGIDPLASPTAVQAEEAGRAFFAFQFAGNEWTQILGRESYRLDWLEKWLSQELKRGTLLFTLRNTSQYSLYESTHSVTESPHEIESFSEASADYYEYSGDFNYKAASKKFEMTKLDHACLFTKRGTRLDMESPCQLNTFLNRVTDELGIYIAADVFQLDPAGKPVLMEPWQHSDFRAARLLRLVTEDEWQRRVFGDIDEEAKLQIDPEPEAFERMQRMARGEIPAIVPQEFDELFREWEKRLE